MKEKKQKEAKIKNISKRAKFSSLLFVAVSIFVGGAIIKAANMYYDIDAGKIIVNEVQRVAKSGQTALEILGISKLGDGGDADYAQFSEAGDLSFVGNANTISKSDGALAIQTTGHNLTMQTIDSGDLELASAGALNIVANASSTWNFATSTLAVVSENFNVNENGNITLREGYGLDTIAAGALNLGNTTAATVNIGNTAATTVAIGAGGSLARTINIGTGTGADTINIGTGGGADVITLGGGAGGTLAINTGDWDITTAGVMTGISGITTNGGYTQSGSDANTFTGAASFTASGTGLAVTNNATVGGTLGVISTLTASNGLTLTTGALNLTATSGYLTLSGLSTSSISTGGNTFNLTSGGASGWSNAGNLSFITTSTGALALTSANAMNLQFGAGNLFTLGNGTTNYFQVATDGTLTLATGGTTAIILDPGGSGTAGTIQLGPGDKILTSTGGAATRVKDEQILRGMVPIFGFDMPVRTATTTFSTISGVIEDYPFPEAISGTTRVHKFVIRYANTGNASTTWEVYNTTVPAQVDQFEVPPSAATDLDVDKGKSYTTEVVEIPVNDDDWRLDVRNASGAIQIYQVFVAAYDEVD